HDVVSSRAAHVCRARTSAWDARGTTPLDGPEGPSARWPAVTGRSRPVLLGCPHPDHLGRSHLFFRRLAGDSRVDACAHQGTRGGGLTSSGINAAPRVGSSPSA